MRRIQVMLVLASAAIFMAGCASGQGYTMNAPELSTVRTIAIVQVAGMLDSAAGGGQVAEYFNERLSSKGYAVIAFNEARPLLSREGVEPRDVETREGAARAGRLLGADALLTINVPEFGQEMSISARLIDTRDGSTLWEGSGSGNTERVWTTVGGAAAGALAGAAIGGHGGGAVAGGVVGGAAGGLAGYFLSPQEQSVARKVVVKICESFPVRY